MITSSKYVTVAHVSSESSDHYLITEPGILTADDIKRKMDWEEPDCLYVEDITLIEFQP